MSDGFDITYTYALVQQLFGDSIWTLYCVNRSHLAIY